MNDATAGDIAYKLGSVNMVAHRDAPQGERHGSYRYEECTREECPKILALITQMRGFVENP